MPTLDQRLKTFEKWLAKRVARNLKKIANREIVKPLRAQIKKQPSHKGGPPRKRSGKFRKLIQARRKFSGALRKGPDGKIPILKIKHWSPISNVLFSEKSGEKYRELKPPPITKRELLIKTLEEQRLKEDIDKQMIKIIDEELKKGFGTEKDRTIRIDF